MPDNDHPQPLGNNARTEFFLYTVILAYLAYLTHEAYLGEESCLITNFSHMSRKPDTLSEIPNLEKTCVSTSRYLNCIEQPSVLFPCDPDDMFATNPIVLRQQLKERDWRFNGSSLHLNLANHQYQAVINTLDIFGRTLGQAMLDDRDNNGRTPLHLAMEIGAPSSVILKLLTDENVIMADKKGVTPLMLAARGEDPVVMKTILDRIGTHRLFEAIAAKDANGRSVSDWNMMPKDALSDRFKKVEVDGKKDESYCFNILFPSSKYPFLYFPSFALSQHAIVSRVVYHSVGIETGDRYKNGVANIAVLATKENARKLIEIATQDSEYAVTARQRLSYLWGQSDDKKSRIWKYIYQELSPIEPALSGQSLVDARVSRQVENRAIMGEYTAKLQKKPSPRQTLEL